MEIKSCCIIGHRKVENSLIVQTRLNEILVDLIENYNVYNFLIGGEGSFDNISHKLLGNLKQKYPNIKRIYVRGKYPFINEDYKNYILESYDETYFPEECLNAGKNVYVLRNEHIIKKSDYCVFYYNENYKPDLKKVAKRAVSTYRTHSGTKLAYLYAKSRNKNIIIISD